MVEEDQGSYEQPQVIPEIPQDYGDGRIAMQKSYGDDFMKEIVEVDDLIERIEHMLRGEFFNGITNKFEKQHEDPLVNEEGIFRIMSIIRSHIHKHLHLTNFSEEDVRRLAYEVCMALIDLLAINQEVFGIKKSDLTIIKTNIDHMVYTALRRAYQQGERRAIFGSTNRNIGETISSNQMMNSFEQMVPRKKKWGLF